jgi:hypothetical protein
LFPVIKTILSLKLIIEFLKTETFRPSMQINWYGC